MYPSDPLVLAKKVRNDTEIDIDHHLMIFIITYIHLKAFDLFFKLHNVINSYSSNILLLLLDGRFNAVASY